MFVMTTINDNLLNLIYKSSETNTKHIEQEESKQIVSEEYLIKDVKKTRIELNKPNEFIIGAHDINSLKYYNPGGEQSKDVPDVIVKYYFILNNNPYENISTTLIKLEQLEPGFKIKFNLNDLSKDDHTVTIIIQTGKKEEKLFLFFDGVKDDEVELESNSENITNQQELNEKEESTQKQNYKLHKSFENIIPEDAYYFAKIKKDEFGIWSKIEIINYGE